MGQGPIMRHYRTGRHCKAGDGMGSPGPGLAGRLALYPRPLPAACRWLPGATAGRQRAARSTAGGSVGPQGGGPGWSVGRWVEGSLEVGRLPVLVQAVGQARRARLAQREGRLKSRAIKEGRSGLCVLSYGSLNLREACRHAAHQNDQVAIGLEADEIAQLGLGQRFADGVAQATRSKFHEIER